MASNIEIKARVSNPAALAERLQNLAGGAARVDAQDDTFFACAHGRLKLRVDGEGRGKLIFYQRPDAAEIKASDFLVSECGDADALRVLLARAYGEQGRVRKLRRVYRVGCCRAHLDRVDGLGDFVELETELAAGETEQAGRQAVADLMAALGIRDEDLIDKAYLDLLAERSKTGVSIALERPDQPDALALIDELDAYQVPLYPAESHHGVDVSVLLQPNAAFAVARDETGQAVGCGAVWCVPEYGELKRMYVRPKCRGKGVARALMDFLEEQAKARGCAAMTLETGIRQHEAIALYRRAGYEFCAPFGSYAEDPNSVFMRKPL